jgi:hypothetical protein
VPNRLATETSPYLLQHAHNPVDWYPWGPEALDRAREEDKPILLSIGYSACHWCHVMERESFEDEATAALMNEHFVSIKVDREERPDLDSVYMRAVQAITGRGGWPLTAFLTPDGRAFYGGTYFPPEPRYGMPSFPQVLQATANAFHNRRDEVEKSSDQLLDMMEGTRAGMGEGGGEGEEAYGEADVTILDHAFRFLNGRFDPALGGFGQAPKFPQPVVLEFLLKHHHDTGRQEALDMAIGTLEAMARGGIRDHLGGGFHRYSVDARWLVPHFEKMLYDNGLLARVYLQAYLVTGGEELREAATSTLDYILADLTSPEGGFYSARDADSEGEEGLFYLWTPEEVDELLGEEEGALFREVYDVTAQGNFEGRSILHLSGGPDQVARERGMAPRELRERLARSREKLEEARRSREHPLRDEKILVAWNSMVLRALAEAGAALGREDYRRAAGRNAAFLLDNLRVDGRLRRSFKDGEARIPAFLEDHAGLGNALLTLYETTLEARWLEEARLLASEILEHFWDEEEEIFFDSARDGEALVVRPRDIMDNATPSGNSLALELLLRLTRLTGETEAWSRVEGALDREAEGMKRFPTAFGRLLSVLAHRQAPPLEVTVLGDPEDDLIRQFVAEAHGRYQPHRVMAGGDPEALPPLPVLEGREPRDGKPTAYVCRDFTCSAPIHDVETLARELEKEGEGGR